MRGRRVVARILAPLIYFIGYRLLCIAQKNVNFCHQYEEFAVTDRGKRTVSDVFPVHLLCFTRVPRGAL